MEQQHSISIQSHLTCPVCFRMRERFICTHCSRYTGPDQTSESFNDKLLRYQQKFQLKNNLSERINQTLMKHEIALSTKNQILEKQHRIQCLKALYHCNRKETETVRKEVKKLYSNIELMKKNGKMWKKFLRKYKAKLNSKIVNASQSKINLEKLSTELYNIRCKNARALVRDLFPIRHIPAKLLSSDLNPIRTKSAEDNVIQRSACDRSHADDKGFDACDDNCSLSDEQLWDLVEASNTVYVNGKWVSLHDDNDDKHSVLGAMLPTNGDYQAYFVWTTEVPALLENPAYHINAAFLYTTQLVNILSMYLDTNLPYKLCYSEFSDMIFDRQKFDTAVSKLNYNVLYLCSLQYQKSYELISTEILKNLRLCIDPDNDCLGRQNIYELDPNTYFLLDTCTDSNIDLAKNQDELTQSTEIDSDDVEMSWINSASPAGNEIKELMTDSPHDELNSGDISADESLASASSLVFSAAALVKYWWQYATNE
ncbi:uncharacterized protein TRIADDRAFT_61249 [Trichoplax adhaerens]|uniref:Beclin 1-associated autophagy-related key regulator n=1 Tax=Trichoplax adhaerens TaxID=10228 RepID=B3SAG3_TRIAD|nr:hypothetical protein TRIADDRAFT_61249 [Trichoplax adhaerens]EDV20307.1 hypothetical protein TRIADDRAFT_61249 [Trichoplax adhaerens]|eukprot:XP_002117257.1 hypothetical protein TRIADDRAFT_61249 [Trichoplax adhaerens]